MAKISPYFASFAFLASCAAFVSFTACSSSSTNGIGVGAAEAGADSGAPAIDAESPATEASTGPDVLAGCTKDPGPPAITVDEASATDPTGGAASFTIAKALEGFPAGTGKLTVAISTEKSSIKCELLEDIAPISVANFVGLARGTRPYKIDGKWKVGRFYDGLTWHRVIPGFVIQGGDPSGDGTGGPGYNLVNENHVAEPLGTLAMAASKAPSGSQFYIVVGNGPPPDYNVFGTCTTENAIQIAKVSRDDSDMPTTPVHMIRVDVARCP